MSPEREGREETDGVVLREFAITVCELCMNGEGTECHVPGCAFWMEDVPPLAFTALLRERGEYEPDDDLVRCEGCPALMQFEDAHHDCEGVALCDDCWASLNLRIDPRVTYPYPAERREK